jgi:sensor c-di-GMP phosphodiesterase-like protein
MSFFVTATAMYIYTSLVIVVLIIVVGNKIHETTSKQCRALFRNAIVIVYTPAVRLILC